MNRAFLVFWLLLIICANTFSQIPALPEITSPNSKSLGIFGDIPVNFFTGTPDISVPIYTVSTGTIKVPIGLRYHPSLVKPNQHPGWVGLGWDLQCTGSIRRIMNYWNDELSESNKSAYYPNGYQAPGSSILKSTDWSDEVNALKEVIALRQYPADPEADEFVFNFLEYSGKIFYTADGWKVISDDNIKVEIIGFIDYNQINKEIDSTYYFGHPPNVSQTRMFKGFTLTTDDGTKYMFGNNGNSDFDAIEFSSTYSQSSQNNPGLLATSWYLKKIIDKNNNVVDFKYKRHYPICNLSFYSNSMDLNSSIYFSGLFGGRTIPLWSNTGPTNVETSFHDGVLFIPVYLKEISTSEQHIVFSTSPSTEKRYSDLYLRYGFDNNGYPNSELELDLPYIMSQNINDLKWEKLDTIIFKDAASSIIKTYKFYYSNSLDIRLTLDSLEEKDVSNTIGQRYIFQYNNIDSLPEYGGNYTDHWGYYNGTDLDGQPFGFLDSLRRTNTSLVKTGLLTSITYPTGGFTSFVWEAHDYSQYIGPVRDTLTNGSGVTGGCRIKEIRSYSNGSQVPITKKYFYLKNYTINGSSLLSSGILNGKPQYGTLIQRFTDLDARPITYSFKTVNAFGSYSLNNQGSHIGYSEV